MKVFCLFEKSGTFKNELKKLGYEAYDIDIIKTDNVDYVLDLFENIDFVFDNLISHDDLVLAFFPCVRFEACSDLLIMCNQRQLIDLTLFDKLTLSSKYLNERALFYSKLCDLIKAALVKGCKLIIENPYQKHNFLFQTLPLKPDFIDMDRSLHGDYYKKPTMFYFINCKPNNILTFECKYIIEKKRIDFQSQNDRSLISPIYASWFIRNVIDLGDIYGK